MRNPNIAILIIVVPFMLMFGVITQVHSDTAYDVCTERCSEFNGDAKYKCMQACVYATRRSNQDTGPRTNKRVGQCNDACAHLQGLDNVVCVRKCLENQDTPRSSHSTTGRRKDDETTKECEKRCSFLQGALKYTCIVKCKKKLKWK